MQTYSQPSVTRTATFNTLDLMARQQSTSIKNVDVAGGLMLREDNRLISAIWCWAQGVRCWYDVCVDPHRFRCRYPLQPLRTRRMTTRDNLRGVLAPSLLSVSARRDSQEKPKSTDALKTRRYLWRTMTALKHVNLRKDKFETSRPNMVCIILVTSLGGPQHPVVKVPNYIADTSRT